MEEIFRVVFSLSVSGSLTGLLILLVRPVTERYFARRWTYYLWMVVLVRLLVPVHADVNLMESLSVRLAAVGSGLADTGDTVETAAGSRDVETASEITQNGQSGAEGAAGSAPALQRTAPGAGTEMAPAAGPSLLYIAGILWIFGVLFTAAQRFHTYRRFVKGVRGTCAPVADGRVHNTLTEIQRRLGIRRRVVLYESADVNSPMLIGLRKPCIYLPSELLSEMTGRENDICLILHHELVHYKRRDIWYKWLFQAAVCIHWFNPLIYVFQRKFNSDCELACDETVLKLLSEEGRRAYGNVLLDVAQKNCSGGAFRGKDLGMHRNVPTMTLLEEESTLKERLRGIAKYHKRGVAVGFCSAAVLVMLLAVAVVCGAAQVRFDYGEIFSKYYWGDLEARFSGGTIEDSFDLDQPIWVNSIGRAYRMYDDDALIANDSESDWWRAWVYSGGDRSVNARKFAFNGSDTLWILYANKETTLELSSAFSLYGGRFKVVCVRPDQTVQTINESGEENTVKITLPQGRNVIKMVGQKARLEDLSIAYGGMIKGDFDGVYTNEDMEYAYQVLDGNRPLDISELEKAIPYLSAEEVSRLYRLAWQEEIVLSEENWEDLWTYSDEEATSRYLLEELQAGKIREFNSSVLCKMAPLMKDATVSECFRCLLERGGVSESEWEDIFIYSDSKKSAQYLAEALRRGEADGFSDKVLDQICYQVSTKSLTDIVTAMDRDQLSFEGLLQHVLPFVQKQDEAVTCICYYIDLRNVLTDAQLREIEGYVTEEDFYRIIEYNTRNK